MRGEIVTAIIGAFIAFAFLGCSTYGKRISYQGETCDKCQQSLYKNCTPFTDSGRYKCKCVNCGRVYKYYLGKQVKCKQTGLVSIQANPKGIQTPLTDGFDK